MLDKYYTEGFGTKQTVIWVGEVVKQLTDRNPHLRLLEIGAGTGGATQSILNTIGTDFDHCTFTDISSSFENAAAKSAAYGDRMTFKVCNAEIDTLQQGFEAGTYDIVVAFMVVHACAKLDDAMANLRKLLKPGDMLILGEGAADGAMQAGAGFIFGPLSGWWRGADEGRTLSPLVNVSEWESILKRTGFSGIDTMSPPTMFDAFSITLFVSTTVDARVDFALDPLAVSSETNSRAPKISLTRVIVLGGQTNPIADLVQKIKTLVSPLAAEALTYKTLEEIPAGVLDDDVHIISLVDLESPVFKDITKKRWYSFRNIFASDKTVLWLTRGRLAEDPFCNMTVGFGRSAIYEEDTLRVQYLDVPSIDTVTAEDVVSRLVCFSAKDLDTDDNKATILYTKEPEILVDAEGYERVPRLFPIDEANHHINSTARPIFHKTRLDDAVVELVQPSSGDVHLRELTRYETDEKLMHITPLDDASSIQLHISNSLQSALRTPLGNRFLVLGTAHGSNKPYVSLTSTLTSLLRVPKQAALAVEDLGKNLVSLSEKALLSLMAAEMVALAVVEPLFCGQRLVLHNPPQVFANAVKRQTLAKGVQVSILADEGYNVDDDATAKLPRFSGGSQIAQILQQPVDCFVGLSTETSENEATISSTLPDRCRVEFARTLFASAATKDSASSANAPVLGPFLKKVTDNLVSHVNNQQQQQQVGVASSSLTDLETAIRPAEGKQQKSTLLSVIKWSVASPTLPARVTRIEN